MAEDITPIAEVHRSPLTGQSWIKALNGRPIADLPVGPLYDEHAMNLMRARQFALESSASHLGALVDELDGMVGWAYSQLHRMNYRKQEDALMLDSMKLRLLSRPIAGEAA